MEEASLTFQDSRRPFGLSLDDYDNSYQLDRNKNLSWPGFKARWEALEYFLFESCFTDGTDRGMQSFKSSTINEVLGADCLRA